MKPLISVCISLGIPLLALRNYISDSQFRDMFQGARGNSKELGIQNLPSL